MVAMITTATLYVKGLLLLSKTMNHKGCQLSCSGLCCTYLGAETLHGAQCLVVSHGNSTQILDVFSIENNGGGGEDVGRNKLGV